MDRAPQRPGPSAPGPDLLATLQRAVGNTAVARAVQRLPAPGSPHDASSVQAVLASRGQPLQRALRQEMEARLGADFSDVRLHTDQAAQRSAAGIGARAYTSGHHVVVGRDGGDKHTLAHELTHVIQQRTGSVSGTVTDDGLRVSDPSDRFEQQAEATAADVMSGPVPTDHVHSTDPARGHGGPATVQRVLEKGLAKGTPVVKHEDEADSPVAYTIHGFSFGSYLIAGGEGTSKPRVTLADKGWGTVENREQSRQEYLSARQEQLDPQAVAARQKQQDLDLGENYLSADYRRINPLLAAFEAVGYTPEQVVTPGFSYQQKEDQVLTAWRELAVSRGYDNETATQAWDAQHLRNTYDIFARINGVWSDFPTPAANAENKVVRGDSRYLYESFGGVLKHENHPEGGYVTINREISWPAVLSTTYGNPLTHSYVKGKEIVWEFSLPEGHRGRTLGGNNKSEEEMTFPVGTRISIKQMLVRKGDHAGDLTAKYGPDAVVIVFADIL
ncbi:DUF4157 domain-containing protein [Kineosporia sp. J2-2]|uniref:DUF4157 domain-containing protein n=1 Tax=Kineosporia corallincola TaxID=2835133 RepID=A0ABS5TS74_9ACTN|nr:DUF4157 domain-containing protein [Kineosporia corallincola]MBT0773659.1 DUF4157 domain-containing protein [Kineosporia corallincola]